MIDAYLVGGAVRDELLGRPAGDKDYVVVNKTPQEMTAAGFKPVGKDFPVFLHPQSGEEYALARTERKSGRGYHGFVFHTGSDVTLEDDLRRRDLTINAMAQGADGKLIDPHGGEKDIKARVLRHVSPAFAEDPVRVLRTARFAAMLADFSVAEETMALMKKITQTGEGDNLTVERVWRELARGIGESAPNKMIEALRECGLLKIILPEVAALEGVAERLDYHPEGDTYRHALMVLEAAAKRGLSPAERFAALLHDIGKGQMPKDILPSHHGHEKKSAEMAAALCARLRVPREFTDLAVLAAAEHGNVHKCMEMRPATVVDLLMRLDAFRRPARFESVLRVCEADFYYWPARADSPYPQGDFLRSALNSVSMVDSAAIAQETKDKFGDTPQNSQKIAEKIRLARIKALTK